MKKEPCFLPADILLPKSDFEKWAVIACDQYTSEPAYWSDAEKIVGDSDSALNMILPEVYLEKDDTPRINAINKAMADSLSRGVFCEYPDSFVFVERTQSDGKIRRGIVGKIDLSRYDYRKGSKASVRATEETVVERIPPRVRIRKDAPLELPHIMLLIDDPDRTVIEPLIGKNFETLYDFDLMKKGGHITGQRLDGAAAQGVMAALDNLEEKGDGLLFCVGDGNHSLATAKECYNMNPTELSRYALVEVVNIHDEALRFEPIYRVLFGVDPEKFIDRLVADLGGQYSGADAQKFTCIFGDNTREISVKPTSKLCVGTLQTYLDAYLKENGQVKIDYIHGEDSVKALCSQENTLGFLFAGMQKSELFPAVNADGSLPRKTFSMGHADDKRFYIEARKIK